MGDAGTHECPVCKQTSTFQAICNYSYWHIYWLCSIVTGRKYFIQCTSCENATPIDKAAVKEQFPNDNIPFMKKRGVFVFAGILLAILVFSGISGMASASAKENRIKAFLAQPKVGDLVEVNLAYVDGSGFGPENAAIKNRKAWGMMRLVEDDGDGYFFATTMKGWDEVAGVRDAYKKNQLTYDMQDLVYLDKAELAALHSSKRLTDVVKP